MNKQELIDVFEDTVLSISSTYPGDFSKSRKMNLDSFPSLTKTRKRIFVENTDSVSAIVKHSDYSEVVVLNMASPRRIGGGVRNGAKAQEECLFRCSNLISMIPESLYPIGVDEAIYTEDVTFFKDFHYDYMSPVTADVITIAAPNLSMDNEDNPPMSLSTYTHLMIDKIKLLLSMAASGGKPTLILGAWGCGVFKNEPRVVATLFKNVLTEMDYIKYFDRVIFAVINDHNSVDDNYTIFKSVLDK